MSNLRYYKQIVDKCLEIALNRDITKEDMYKLSKESAEDNINEDNWNLADEIKGWIDTQSKTKLESFASAVGKTFGTVTMSDGRLAQLQVRLELNENEFENA